MKKLLVSSLLLLALISTPCHAGWFSNFISTITPGGWVEQEWDKVFGNDDKHSPVLNGIGSNNIDIGAIPSVPEIDPAGVLMIGVALLVLRKKGGRK